MPHVPQAHQEAALHQSIADQSLGHDSTGGLGPKGGEADQQHSDDGRPRQIPLLRVHQTERSQCQRAEPRRDGR